MDLATHIRRIITHIKVEVQGKDIGDQHQEYVRGFDTALRDIACKLQHVLNVADYPSTTDTMTYYFLPDDTCIHEDDWAERGDVDDYWEYTFQGDELGIISHHLEHGASEESNRLLHTLALGTGNNQDFHHAMFIVLSEYL